MRKLTKIEVGSLAHGSEFRLTTRGLVWRVDRQQEDFTFATPLTAAGLPGEQKLLSCRTVVFCSDALRWQDARETGTYLFLEDAR